MQTRANDERPNGPDLTNAIVLVCEADAEWCCEGHRQMYDRIVHELGYDPNDVFEVRVTEAGTEVDFVDFDDNDWPIVTRRHAASARRAFAEPSAARD